MSFIRACFFAFFFLFAIKAAAQVQRARYNTSIATKSYGFYEYLPQGYSTGTQQYPLIIFMHGLGQCGNGDSSQLPRVLQGLAKVIQDGRFPTSFTVANQTHRFIVLSPQFKSWPVAAQLEEVINYAVSHYRVNLSRIYLTGYSMGAGVVWDYASNNTIYANRVAAILPVAGSSFADSARGRVIAAANLPVWATHNNGDPTVFVSKTHNYINYINQVPAPVPAAKETIFGATKHDAWTKTHDPLFKEGGLNVYEWLLQYQRNTLTAGNSGPVCKGSTLQLSAFEVAGATYKWTGPNGFTSTLRSPAISNATAAAAGTYTVTLTKGDSTATATTVVRFEEVKTFYRDVDQDNFGSAIAVSACRAPAGYVSASGDCNDSTKEIFPGALDICDGLDNDCNGKIDDAPLQTFYRDYDRDSYGSPTVTTVACVKPSGYVPVAGDCNDRKATVYPGAPELNDSLDNNCNGVVDENAALKTFYRDADKDGYGNASAKTTAYLQPAGYVLTAGDCNDANVAIHPTAAELCDGIDNDCNGVIDDRLTLKTFYQDYDKDGYGNAAVKKAACAAPAGYVSVSGDCNDKNAAIKPGAIEIARNGLDDNCNGQIDETSNRYVNVNLYGGTNAYSNTTWNNWNVGTAKAINKSITALKYSDGTTSTVAAVLSSTEAVGDNGSTYGGTMAPAEVLRYCSNATTSRTLTLSGLSTSKTYSVEFYASRAKTGYSSLFTIGTTTVTVNTDNNKTTKASFTNLKANSAGQIVVIIKGGTTTNAYPYNYLNGFVLAETGENTTRTANTQIAVLTINQMAVESTGLQVQAFPNPTTDQFTFIIKSSSNSLAHLKIFNALGSLIEVKNAVVPNTSLVLGNRYQPGVYYIEIMQEKKRMRVKVVKLPD